MAIVSCPECSKKLKVADTSIGKKVKCSCGTVFVAMAEAAAVAVAATTEKVLVACTDCAAKLKVAAASLGKKMKCPKCAAIFVAQAESEASSVPPMAPPMPRDDDDVPKLKPRLNAKKNLADEDDLLAFAEEDAAKAMGGFTDDDDDAIPISKAKVTSGKKRDVDLEDELRIPAGKKPVKAPAAATAGAPVYPSRLLPNLLVTLLVLVYGGAVAAVFFQMFSPAKEIGLKEPALKFGTKPPNLPGLIQQLEKEKVMDKEKDKDLDKDKVPDKDKDLDKDKDEKGNGSAFNPPSQVRGDFVNELTIDNTPSRVTTYLGQRLG